MHTLTLDRQEEFGARFRMSYDQDPRGGRLPALEKNILKARALEMALVLFHAEQLRERILDAVQGHDEFLARLRDEAEVTQRVPKGSSKPIKKCLEALVADGVFTADEMAEIERLIDYRNDVGHRIHELTADISAKRYVREHVRFRNAKPGAKKYDNRALPRLRHFGEQLARRTERHIQTLSMAPLLFEAAEKTLDEEIKRLVRKIEKQTATRRAEIEVLKRELNLEGSELSERKDPRHPLNQYDDGRLTARGQEICYRLFDLGKSPMAVAIFMGLTVGAATKRRKMWAAAGGIDRDKPDFDALPHRKFYRSHDDD